MSLGTIISKYSGFLIILMTSNLINVEMTFKTSNVRTLFNEFYNVYTSIIYNFNALFYC